MKATGHLAWLLALAGPGCGLLLAENPDFETDDDSSTGETGETDTSERPEPPTQLIVELLGEGDDVEADPLGPALLLAGGDRLDASFAWLNARIDGGDVVVLQHSGPATLGQQLYAGLDAVDSVQTVIMPSNVGLLATLWLNYALDHAEAVLIVGDDPRALYWPNAWLRDALEDAWLRGAVLGGVDAGVSLLGEFAYTGMAGPLDSARALLDPYDEALTLERAHLRYPPLANAVLEPRFAAHDRMGRLLSCSARVLADGWAPALVGVGIDEHTVLAIDRHGVGEVLGDGHVYLLHVDQPATVCEAGSPLELGPVPVTRLAAGDTCSWPGGISELPTFDVSADDGELIPADPY